MNVANTLFILEWFLGLAIRNLPKLAIVIMFPFNISFRKVSKNNLIIILDASKLKPVEHLTLAISSSKPKEEIETVFITVSKYLSIPGSKLSSLI